jgi:hypothetical protein
MPRYRAYLANLLVQGEERTDQPGGGWIRNRTRFRLGGFSLELLRTAASFATPASQMKGGFHYTHDLIVENVEPSDLAKVERIVEEVTELLSFGTLSHVVKFGQQYDGSTNRRSVRGVALYFRPAFTQGDEIRRLLELTWPTYRKLRRRRKLNVVMDYLVTGETGQPLEVKLLIVSAVLECLKSTYAKQAGYKYHKPAWRRISSPPKPNPKNEPIVNFEKLLREMFGKVGMRRPLRRLIQLRNDIVHNGVSARPHESQFTTYEYAQELAREYLLRLLGFHGQFYSYNTRTMRTI